MLSLALLAAAWAARVQVVSEGSPDVSELAERLGVPMERVEVVPFSSLLATPAGILEGGEVHGCHGAPATHQEIAEGLSRAEVDVSWMDYGLARQKLERVRAQLRCLSEPVRPEMAHRAYYLHGMVAFQEGLEDEARTLFRLALSFRPDEPWDTNFPPDGHPLYDKARADLQAGVPVGLRVVPGRNAIWLDGRPALSPLLVTPGPHLLQLGSTAYEVWVPPTDQVTLISPAFFSPADLRLMGEAAQRERIAPLLEYALDPLARAWVDYGGALWERSSPQVWAPYQPLQPVDVPLRPVLHPPSPWACVALVGAGGAAAAWGAAASTPEDADLRWQAAAWTSAAALAGVRWWFQKEPPTVPLFSP